MAPTTARKVYDPDAKVKQAPFEMVAITNKQRDEWERTRAAFLMHQPAFAHILYTLMVSQLGNDPQAVFVKDVPIAATDGINLYLNPEKFFPLTLQERIFVMAHEVSHCIFDHCGLMHSWARRGKITYADGTSHPYIHELMNVAMDLVINDMLVESKVGSMPQCGMRDTSIAKGSDSVIDAYRKVFEQAQKRGQIKKIGAGVSGGEAAGVKGEHFDHHLKPGTGQGKDPTSAAAERSEQQWATEVAAGLAAARAQGKEPSLIDRMFGQLLTPQVSWQEHIQAFFARKVGSGAYDWRRPDRRLITRDEAIYAPGRSGYGAGCVVIGVDTSGSIGPATLDMFFAEMAGILEDVRPKRLVVVWCDARVGRVDEAEDPGDLNVIRAKGVPGGGGTSFVPVFEEVAKMGLAPDALVYLTDGLGTFPHTPPSYPVIWGSLYLTPDKYPFGEVVMIPQQK